MENDANEPIGYLYVRPGDAGYSVVGMCCAAKVEHYSPVRRCNVEPYAQHCGECGRELVKPRTPVWPELFDGKVTYE